jgi:hypothetical protein
MKHYSSVKPAKCPECGSSRIVTYLYGEFAYSEELMDDITSGKVILGGSFISGYDHDWECIDCKAEIFRRE